MNTLFRTRVMQNLVANYVGAVINVLAPLLAIPVLVRVLGQEHWGLVAFANLMVGVMLMLNTGIAQALVRELAHRWTDSENDRLRVATLLRGYEGVYWCAALVVALAVLPFISWISDRWLNTSPEAAALARVSVTAAVVLFVFSLPASIYRGTLLALQEHGLLNIIRTAATILKVGGGVLVVLATSSVPAYLAVLVGISAMETIAMAVASWSFMPLRRGEIAFDLYEVRTTLRFSITMSALVMLGVATTQIDRIFVSALLPVRELGVYSIAVSLAFGVLQIVYPLFTSVMPALVAVGADPCRRFAASRNLLLVVLAIILVVGVLYATFGTFALTLWLGDAELANRVAQPLTWLLLGSALNTVYNVGYTNWVSIGEVRWIAWVNILSILLVLAVLPFTVKAWGIVGAASSYVIVNIVGVAVTLFWLGQSRLHAKRS